jgi:ribose transport system permease protein
MPENGSAGRIDPLEAISTMKEFIINPLKALILPASLYLILLLLIPDRVGNVNTLYIMLSMSVIPTIVAYGVSFGWISGLWDFSIGSRVTFSSLVGAVGGNLFGIPGLFLGSIAASLLLSAVSGGIFRILRIPSLVVSLGMLMIFEVGGNSFGHVVGELWPGMSTGYYIRLDQSLTFLGTTPWNLMILALTSCIFGIVYYRTKFSNQARVVGSDELIARNVGINPMRVKFATYMVGGFFLGIAAALTAAYSGSASPQTNMTTMSAVFRPMMAMVIALCMQRLAPVPLGVFIGTFSLNIIFTGIIALGWSDDLQNVILGFFLVVIVAFPQIWNDIQTVLRRKRMRRMFSLRNNN